MEEKRKAFGGGKCIICGYSKTFDLHHENGQVYVLCPNCHALITRGIATLQELLNPGT